VGEWAPGHAGRACRRGHSDSEGLGDELLAWLREQGDWVQLGSADEQKPAKDGTVEA
jgi:hypothetical protein